MSKARATLKITGVTLLAAILALGIYEGIKLRQAHSKLNSVFAPYRTAEAKINPEVLAWADLTPRQQEMLLQIEDPGFFDHKGVDITTKGARLTSITQAVAKKLFFDDFKPGFAKLEQTLIARYVITPNVDKKSQLTAFLNVVYLGNHQGEPVYGFGDGAQMYFGKSVPDLADDEFMRLTGALIAPKAYPPIAGNEKSDARLARLKKLTAGECVPQGVTDVTLEVCK